MFDRDQKGISLLFERIMTGGYSPDNRNRPEGEDIEKIKEELTRDIAIIFNKYDRDEGSDLVMQMISNYSDSVLKQIFRSINSNQTFDINTAFLSNAIAKHLGKGEDEEGLSTFDQIKDELDIDHPLQMGRKSLMLHKKKAQDAVDTKGETLKFLMKSFAKYEPYAGAPERPEMRDLILSYAKQGKLPEMKTQLQYIINTSKTQEGKHNAQRLMDRLMHFN
tara:strand:+ start:730 stop:1392 length:663 start_codon:yes stop_codon:yes gene_type:complete